MTSRPLRTTATMVIAVMLVLGACRPPIGEGPVEPDPTESLAPGETHGPVESAGPVDSRDSATLAPRTAPPAAALQPEREINVQVRLFEGLSPIVASIMYAETLDLYRDVNLVVDLTPPIPGYDPFAVDDAEDVVPLWIGTFADVAPASEGGLRLVAVGELAGRDTTVLVTPADGPAVTVGDLIGDVLAQNPGAIASARAAGAAAGTSFRLPDDVGLPFDPAPLLDGSILAAVVSNDDGWARIQEGALAFGLDPAAFRAVPLHSADAPILGPLVWARPADLEQPDLRAAVTAFLGTVAQAQIACRDALEDCAGVASAQSDRLPEGIAWSINEIDRLLFPSADGILHLDPEAWERTVAAMRAADVGGLDGLTYRNDLVDAVLAALSELDIRGADWTPPEVALLPA